MSMPCAEGASLALDVATQGLELFEDRLRSMSRRCLLGVSIGAASVLVSQPAAAEIRVSERTAIANNGIVRTLLEEHVAPDGSTFRMLLDIFPPGIVVPPHRHSVVGLNYIVDGRAESQYEGGPLLKLGRGDSFKDLAGPRHVMFRNPDEKVPLVVILSFTVPRGTPFFIPD